MNEPLRCLHRKIFKDVWPFCNIMHERVKATLYCLANIQSPATNLSMTIFLNPSEIKEVWDLRCILQSSNLIIQQGNYVFEDLI